VPDFTREGWTIDSVPKVRTPTGWTDPIRACGTNECERVYVATKNQRYCSRHQDEARRQSQRRAEPN
jgi:hypothetical protein